MNINPQHIHDIIIQETRKILQEFYSVERKKYISKYFRGLFYQIVENWSLCFYCNNIQMNDRLYHHWREELLTQMYNLQSYTLKQGDKEKATQEAINLWVDNNILQKIIHNKFLSENIQVNQEIEEWIIDEFNRNISIIAHVISVDDFKEYENYINNIFPN